MRRILIAGAATLALTGTAIAQMCGAPQGTAQSAQAGSMAGCMGMMRQAETDDPMADKPAQKPATGGMMCPCCRNMAMMGGMKHDEPKAGDAKPGEPKHDMPMPMPKQ